MSLKLGFDCFLLWFIPIAPSKPRGKGHEFAVYDKEQMAENNQNRHHGNKDSNNPVQNAIA